MNLLQTLNTFASSANTNPHVQRITRGWSVNIHLECLEGDHRYLLEVKEGTIANVSQITESEHRQATVMDAHDHVLLRTDNQCFTDIFAGQRNPALASLEGDLEVYGDESHSVKLDAITLILWGL